MALSGPASLADASEVPVVESARRSLTYAGQGRWLTVANRYRDDIVRRLGEDHGKGSIRARNLCDYVAASAPLHCCDGWALLGRALSCHMRGDANVARHLAYYAELRAAMSVLATQGVGVFSRKHFIMRANGTPEKITDGGTHLAAWDLLEAWASLSHAGDVLGEILQPGGTPVSDWVAALPKRVAWRPIASAWLKEIGLDLQLFGKQDHDARNEASYRPSHLRSTHTLASMRAVRAAKEIWALLEPARPLSFGQVDRYLLRRTLLTAFNSVTGQSARRKPAVYRRQVEQAAASLLSGPDATEWTSFLCDQDPKDPEILLMADMKPRPARNDYHVSMMARALLLLRVASGANRRMLKAAGVPLERLAFWWQPYGQGLGLWDQPAPTVEELTDGWDDAKAALEDIEIALGDGTADSYHSVVDGLAKPLARLTGMEIVGVWSLAA
jgi:hypothetical protein